MSEAAYLVLNHSGIWFHRNLRQISYLYFVYKRYNICRFAYKLLTVSMNDFAVIGHLVMRTGLWDRQGANFASRYKEMYGVELFLR